MTKEEVEQCALNAFGVTKNSGFIALKSTVPGTCHVGKFSGNRLNSSTLRSQLLFCLDSVDWNDTEAGVKKLFHEDQRIFVQTGNDRWDIYKGVGYEENTQPIMWKQISGLRAFLSNLPNLELAVSPSQTQSGIVLTSESYLRRYDQYLAAIRTKPFVLLAGISGTGKSRLVRQLARGCCPKWKDEAKTQEHPLYNEQKPGNFEMIQVRPNWHDSSELMGYVTRVVKTNEPPKYLITAFVEFLAKAWVYRDVPFFLCLDEMNLAPVEQYFAEYLSVIETRKRRKVKLGEAEDELITTDSIVRWENLERDTFDNAVNDLFDGKDWAKEALYGRVEEVKTLIKADKGIRIPPNLVVMGTVNMDETTCSFSRKVLDRAMSFELNDVSDMYDPSKLAGESDLEFGTIQSAAATTKLLTGKEVYDVRPALGKKILEILELLNEKEVDAKKEDGTDDAGQKIFLLARTPFKIAYRTRNEIMIYCLERCGGGNDEQGVTVLPKALDEALSMKVLSRVEGDNLHVPRKWLVTLSATIEKALSVLPGYDKDVCKVCREKLAEMADQSDHGYTSFWTR